GDSGRCGRSGLTLHRLERQFHRNLYHDGRAGKNGTLVTSSAAGDEFTVVAVACGRDGFLACILESVEGGLAVTLCHHTAHVRVTDKQTGDPLLFRSLGVVP